MYVKIQKMKLTFTKILPAQFWNNEYQTVKGFKSGPTFCRSLADLGSNPGVQTDL